MKLGLIGYPLGHSRSPEIHKYLTGEDYSLWELKPENLDEFMKRKDFDGINVTIPYKEAVLPYLDEIEENAAKIGAVNCIVHHNGKLTGYNTDCMGFAGMVRSHGINFAGKNVAVLGTGGASKAVFEAVKDLSGIPYRISRSKDKGDMDYAELYEREDMFSYIVNTTPAGMYPHTDEVPCDLSKFLHLQGIIDIIANPLCTHWMLEAKLRGIPALGGWEMLVRQAYYADKCFGLEVRNPDAVTGCIRDLKKAQMNIVLIGMPSSGKTTLGKKLAEITGRNFIDLDERVKSDTGMEIRQIFEQYGEDAFREAETKAVAAVKDTPGNVISCGGGIIKRKRNMEYLKERGYIVWVQRDLELLEPTEDRPLSSVREDLVQLFHERKPLYEKYADAVVRNNTSVEDVIAELQKIPEV